MLLHQFFGLVECIHITEHSLCIVQHISKRVTLRLRKQILGYKGLKHRPLHTCIVVQVLYILDSAILRYAVIEAFGSGSKHKKHKPMNIFEPAINGASYRKNKL